MSWQTGVVDGVTIQRRVASGSSYQAAYEAVLSALAAQLAGDFGYTDSGWLCRVWGCADSANLTLANAVIESGYARNTVTAGAAGGDTITNKANISASGYLSSNTPANAGDNSATTRWMCDAATGWLRYDETTTTTIVSYTMQLDAEMVGYAGAMTWQFQGSANGTTWTTLDIRTSKSFIANVKKTFALSAAATYRYYRLNFTAVTGTYCAVSEWELLAEGTAGSVNACTITGTSYPLSTAPAAGRLYLRAYNADASGLIDIGNSGSNKVEIYRSLDGNSTWSAALAIEGSKLIGDNVYDLWTPEFDMSAATGLGFKLQSFARSVAPNLRLLQVLGLGRMAS